MIEEPYRWVEAVANRREYIETQLAGGNPLVALGYDGGILFFTAGGAQQKIFEVYDRIALGAIGHPGDVERLRLTAIELASTEGFTRSAADVSLRRLAYYSLSPVLKAAFEQIYGAPFLARLLFAELGREAGDDLFLTLEYDGSITPAGVSTSRGARDHAVLAGTAAAAEKMAEWLAGKTGNSRRTLATALELAGTACAVGRMPLEADGEMPTAEEIKAFRQKEGKRIAIEAAVLERDAAAAICYRTLEPGEIRSRAE